MFKILDDLMRATWWVVIILVIMFCFGIGRIGHTRIPIQVRSIELKSFDGRDYIHSVQYENGETVLIKGLDSYSIRKIKETGFIYIQRDENWRLGTGLISLLLLVPIFGGAIDIDNWVTGNPVRFFVTTDAGYRHCETKYSTIARLAALFIMTYYTICNFFGAKHKVDFNEILRNIK